MKCHKCKFENSAGMNFCGKCGAKLERLCPQCDFSNPPSHGFCGKCGHNLTLPSETAPKDLSFDEKLEKIQRYLPKGLTEKILSQKDKIEGERKQVTVMFCDMEGFTPLTERLGPDEAYTIMDQVYEILIHKVHHYEGTVNEMTGDGIVALFGAPVSLEDAPQRAIRSAMAIHREMSKFSDRIRKEKEDIPPLRMRVGIHTGPVVVGTVGNDLRVEFKAVGDTVNLASRMEGLAEPGTTYVTEDVFRVTEGFFRFEALGEKEIKGKEEPINAYRVLAHSTRRTRFDVSAERGLTPFIGREREIELLHDGFERSKAGRGQAFSIVSEAGVGKSRLLYEFRKALTSEDVTFLEGKCLSYSRGVAYHPIIDILKSNFDIHDEDRDSEIREKVKRGLKILDADEASTLPYLLDLLSVKESGIDKIAMSPEAKRDRIIGAIKRIALKGSEMRPLILAFEDLHWMDKSSEEVFKQFLESIPGARVLLIFTYRPEFVHTWGGKSYHSQLTLNRFSNRESLAMVSYILGTEDIESVLAAFILEKTEGIPFFVEEFIKSLRDLRIIERKDGTYRIIKDVQSLAIPATIQDVIMARVDSLPEIAKGVLQTGSVVGREFDHDLITMLMELPEPEILSHLSVLKESELVYERGIYPQSAYIFKHALTHEVTYNSLLLKRRKEIHQEVGKAIEQIYPERLEEFYEMLAYHYSKSDDPVKACHYLKLSGNKCTKNYSLWEAFRFYKEAISILKHQPATEKKKREQIEVHLLVTIPMHLLGHPEDSLQILQEGAMISKETGEERSLSIFYSKLAAYYALKTDPIRAVEYADDSFRMAEKTRDIELIAPIACELCVSNFQAGTFFRIVEVVPQVLGELEKSRKQGDTFGIRYNAYSGLCAHCAYALAMLGDFEEGKALSEKGLRSASDINNTYALGWVEFCYGFLFLSMGDGENAIEHIERSIKHIEEAQAVHISGMAQAGLGYGHYLLGELEAAEKHVEKGIKINHDAGLPYFLSLFHCFLSMIYFDSGDLKKAQESIEEAIRLSQNRNEKQNESISRICFGRILGRSETLKGGRWEESIQQGIKLSEELRLKPYSAQGYLFLGEVYADRGKKEKAFENLKRAEGMYREMGMDYWMDKTQEVLRRL